MRMTEERDTLLEFPCRFPIKAFGEQQSGFEDVVFDLVRVHVPELERSAISQRASSRGRYIAITVEITAQSQGQLDAIYRDLSNHDAVLMSL